MLNNDLRIILFDWFHAFNISIGWVLFSTKHVILSQTPSLSLSFSIFLKFSTSCQNKKMKYENRRSSVFPWSSKGKLICGWTECQRARERGRDRVKRQIAKNDEEYTPARTQTFSTFIFIHPQCVKCGYWPRKKQQQQQEQQKWNKILKWICVFFLPHFFLFLYLCLPSHPPIRRSLPVKSLLLLLGVK